MATSFKPTAKESSSAMPSSSAADSPRTRTRSQSQSQSQPQPQPQPQSQSQSQSHPQSHPQSQPQSQSQSQSQPQPESPKSYKSQRPQKSQVDGKSYYGYLYNEDKSPTPIFDALLRATAQYIIDHIGDTNDKQLNARKLSAFYHAVGGDYDSLFLNAPNETLSYIWQALGVQHTLQPVPDNDFAKPSVPALTLRGFVRWQSIQLLLGPEEHVPYLQYAVKNWNLKHPYTGDSFPTDLPATAFPAVCDPAVDEWHKACGEKLREAATPSGEDDKPSRRHDTDAHMYASSDNKTFTSSNKAPPRYRAESEYFRSRRPRSYVHVPEPRYPPHPSHPIAPEANHRVSSSSGSSLDDFPRGRRHSDAKPPPVIKREDTRSSVHLEPHRPPNVRRHSHSYQSPYAASGPDSDSESDTVRASPRHSGSIPQPPPVVRRIPVATAVPAPASSRNRRSELRAEDTRRMSIPAEIKQKVTSFLMSSSGRHRSTSREIDPSIHPSVRYRKEIPRARPSRSLSGESYTSDGSLHEIAPKYTTRNGREHNRSRDRPISRDLEREMEFERELDRERARELEDLQRKSRREKAYLRPATNRRTSSHADADRRRQDALWDMRDRHRDSRDLERETRRNLTADEMDRRERRRYQDRGPSPIMVGGGSRRYAR
ncbi:hypothetical protein F5B17DRAFT_311671 [Nemania serpens]|nr:hypothetical protein F5B17DRAFT_311671 [Nemania serpens]